MTLEQRWSEGRSAFVVPLERFDPRAFDVAPIAGDVEARTFVVEHHYSKSYPAARRRFGLYLRGELAGVAVFSHPCRDDVLTSVFPGVATDSMELGRFVLLPCAKFNAETWFLARAFELLRADGVRGVVSFSDPMPRETSAGATVFAGHIGTIYQAHNAAFLGRGPRRSIRLLPDGRTFSARAINKIRAGERGFEHAVRALVAAGARPLKDGEDRRAWLARALAVTRTVRHPGNLKYAWAIDRREKRALQRRALETNHPPLLFYPARRAA